MINRITLLFFIGLGFAETGNIRITVLSTMVADYDYLGEWGFSALIESGDEKLLFDTGFREMEINGESFLRYPRVHHGMPKISKVSLRCNF